MGKREQYQKKMEQQFNQLSARIQELLEMVEAKTRREVAKQAETLPPKLEAARKKLEELRSASGDAWQDLRPGLERAWQELKASFDKAASGFK